MARLPRYALPGLPQHVIQRGNNRSALFAEPADYFFFRACLATACQHHSCRIHAYVLMTNHVHLLVSPQTAGGIGQLMQSVGRRYVHYFNRRYGRTGTLWEGRYRATPVDTERYLLTCYRYIELNPVRAGLVKEPADYPWSSHRANAWGDRDPLVTAHERFEALGAEPGQRRTAYRALFKEQLDQTILRDIREATNKGWVMGDDRFGRELAALVRRRCWPRSPGRPRRNPERGEIGV